VCAPAAACSCFLSEVLDELNRWQQVMILMTLVIVRWPLRLARCWNAALMAARAANPVLSRAATRPGLASSLLDDIDALLLWQIGLLITIWFYSSKSTNCCIEMRQILGCDPSETAPCRGFVGDCSLLQAQFSAVQGSGIDTFVCTQFPDVRPACLARHQPSSCLTPARRLLARSSRNRAQRRSPVSMWQGWAVWCRMPPGSAPWLAAAARGRGALKEGSRRLLWHASCGAPAERRWRRVTEAGRLLVRLVDGGRHIRRHLLPRDRHPSGAAPTRLATPTRFALHEPAAPARGSDEAWPDGSFCAAAALAAQLIAFQASTQSGPPRASQLSSPSMPAHACADVHGDGERGGVFGGMAGPARVKVCTPHRHVTTGRHSLTRHEMCPPLLVLYEAFVGLSMHSLHRESAA